jgi:hypothetical protein
VLGGVSSAPLLIVSWIPARGADGYVIDVTFDNGDNWSRVANTTSNHASFPARRGLITIRVAGFGLAQGEYTEWIGDPYSAPPPDVQSFLVNAQPDGTRQFTWLMAGLPADLSGFKIRYRLGTGWTWDDLTDMHTNLLLSSPFESNQLAAGDYTFAIKAYDDSGHESDNAKFIIASLADPRLAGIIYNVLPNNTGWAGTKTNCFIDGNSLSASDSTNWSDLITWNAYTQWVFSPASSISYEHTVIDIGAVLNFTPIVSAVANGTITLQESHSNDGSSYSSFATIGAAITARYIKIKITVAGSFPYITLLDIKLNGKSLEEGIQDLTTSGLTGSYRIGTGDIRLPLTKSYTNITQVQVTLQNVGAGWSWELVDKTPTYGPRIKIYNASNVLADAVIDAYVRGY